MKHLSAIFTFTFLLHLSASAAVPLRWTVETSRAQPATFEAFQGETLDFEAALQSYGKPLEAPSNYAFYWQTNGMGSAYWSAPCTVPGASSPRGADTNLLRATWLPSYDVGARAYNCFIGLSNSIYHAAFQLRLRPSPGAVPNELPLPQKVIDFAQVTVLNPPWSGGGGSGGVDTNAVIDITNPLIATATNAVPRIVMGNHEIRADLTAKVQSGWTDWDPNRVWNTNIVTEGDVRWTGVWFEKDQGWRSFEETYIDGEWVGTADIYMDGGNTNPDAAELTFPDGTVTRRVPATAETRLATTNDLFATVRSATNDLATTLNSKKADEFTQWECFSLDEMMVVVWVTNGWFFVYGDQSYSDLLSTNKNAVFLQGYDGDTATRKRVLRTGEAATPQELTNAISTNNPAFVAAVQSIAPSSPPSLRLYDEVRGCWWIGRMVNGVISWEVEE